MSYPDPHPDPHVVPWADWVPASYDDVPEHLIDLWVAVWSHDDLIDRIWYGEWPPDRELTTGSELCTCPIVDCDPGHYRRRAPSCRYHFPAGRCRCVWDVTHPTQHHRIPNRSCPAHWQAPEPAPPAVPPCTCEYRHNYARMTLPARAGQRARSVRYIARSYFLLDPWCPHHGEPPRWTPTGRPWETTLGPDETT